MEGVYLTLSKLKLQLISATSKINNVNVIERNGNHLSKQREIFQAAGEKITNMKLLLNSLLSLYVMTAVLIMIQRSQY